MDNDYRTWLAERFDKVDEDNADIKKELKTVRDTVTTHSVYWSITKWSVAGIIGTVLSWFGVSYRQH